MAASTEASDGNSMEKPVLEPLSFSHIEDESQDGCDNLSDGPDVLKTEQPMLETSHLCVCLLCEKELDMSDANKRNTCLEHLLAIHNLVIGEVELIADLRAYFRYWKERLKENSLSEFCTSLESSSVKDTGTSNSDVSSSRYYLLCDVLPEDRDLRQFLQQKKLTKVLDQQQKERNDRSFCKECIFCRKQFTGRRADFINHMASDHAFNIGQPDNLVYVDEFLEILQSKLNNLQCLYCEKVFKDRFTLKEHMRKKQHRKINAQNKTYDKFYIINYLEMGKNWERIQSEEEDSSDNESNEEIESEEWTEDPSSQAVCLFCPYSSSSAEKLKQHLQELHDFDLDTIKRENGLNFYHQVKLINFIRRQVHQCLCYGCSSKFHTKKELLDHMHTQNHIIRLPEEKQWDQPQYFFPTYENDNLLCQLDDSEGDCEEVAQDQHPFTTFCADMKF